MTAPIPDRREYATLELRDAALRDSLPSIHREFGGQPSESTQVPMPPIVFILPADGEALQAAQRAGLMTIEAEAGVVVETLQGVDVAAALCVGCPWLAPLVRRYVRVVRVAQGERLVGTRRELVAMAMGAMT